MNDTMNLPLGLLFKDLEGVQRDLWKAWDRVSELEIEHRPERPRCKVAWRGTLSGMEYEHAPESLKHLRSHPTYRLDRRYAVEAYFQYIKELRAFEERTGIREARRKGEEQRARLHRIQNAITAIPIRSRQDAAIKANFLNTEFEDNLETPWDVVWLQLHDWLTA